MYNFISQYNLNSNSNDTIWTNNWTDTSISYVTGIKGNSASFNWTTSKIVSASLGAIFGNYDWWLSVWINPETTWSDRAIITDLTWNFGIWFSNAWKVWIRDNLATFWNETGTSVSNSSWQHFFFQMRMFELPPWTFNYRMAIYKNSTFIEEVTTSNFNNSWSAQFWVLWGSTYFYKWLIDHVTLWTWIISQWEINALYNWWIPPDIPFQSNFFPLF